MKTVTNFARLALAFILTGAIGYAKDEPYLRANHKILGHEVQAYQQHAQDRAQTLYYYFAQPQPQPHPTITKADTKGAVEAIRKDLTASDKALAKLKSAHAKEPDVGKLIESIEKHHAKAHEVCGMAEEECAKENGDDAVCSECCSQMWHELDAAKADTQKLLKMLKIDKLEAPKKVETKPDPSKKAAK